MARRQAHFRDPRAVAILAALYCLSFGWGARLAFTAPRSKHAPAYCRELVLDPREPSAEEIQAFRDSHSHVSASEAKKYLRGLFEALTVEVLTVDGTIQSYRPKWITRSYADSSLRLSVLQPQEFALKLENYDPWARVHRGVLFENREFSTGELLEGFIRRQEKMDTPRDPDGFRKTYSEARAQELVRESHRSYHFALENPVDLYFQTKKHLDGKTPPAAMDPYLSSSLNYNVAERFSRGRDDGKGTRIITTSRLPLQGSLYADAADLLGQKLKAVDKKFNAKTIDVLGEREVMLVGGVDPDAKTRIIARDSQDRFLKVLERDPRDPTRFSVLEQTAKRGNQFEVTQSFYRLKTSRGKPAFEKLDEKPSFAMQTVSRVEGLDPQFSKLLAQDSGVFEGYSLKLHTLMVLRKFESQVGHFGLTPRQRELFAFTLALHDIGKPIALKTGQKENQHAETLPLLRDALARLGFEASEIRVAATLIDNDLVGHLLQGEISLTQAKTALKALAKSAGLAPGDFLRLQWLYFVSDAGSYPYLESILFVSQKGKLQPRAPAFEKLRESVQRP